MYDDRSRAEHHVFVLYNETKFHASVVKFLGMSITFVNMDHLSNLAAFTCFHRTAPVGRNIKRPSDPAIYGKGSLNEIV